MTVLNGNIKYLGYTLLLVTIFGYQSLFATHSFGGYISYEHVSGTTYEFSVVLFQDGNSPAIGRREIEINWGDNSSDTLLATNQENLGVFDGITLIKTTYKQIHTYPGPFFYAVTVEDPNRIPGIVNMQNSVNTPLYLETVLRVPQMQANYNHSIIPSANLLVISETNSTLKFNLAAHDIDGDVLNYQITSTKGIGGGVAPSYQIPQGVSVEAENGEFTWSTPNNPGLYQFTMVVTECRKDVTFSSMSIDFMVIVTNNFSNTSFAGSYLADTNDRGNISYTLNPNDSLAVDLDPGNLFDEIRLIDGANLASLNDSNEFKVTHTANASRCTPYLFIAEGTKGTINQYLSILVNMVDSNSSNCDTLCKINSTGIFEVAKNNLKSVMVPNPFKDYTTLQLERDLPLSTIHQLTIYNTSGQAIRSKRIEEKNNIIIPRGKLTPGIYFYSINSENRIIGNGKFVVY